MTTSCPSGCKKRDTTRITLGSCTEHLPVGDESCADLDHRWNAHSIDNYDSPPVRGFNGSDFILDPFTYDYLNVHMTRNGAPPVGYKGQYSPDVTAEKAYGFLEEATQHPEPWFLAVAPVAPHSHARLVPEDEFEVDMPKYAERHAHLFKDYEIPRTANFNPEKVGVFIFL